MAVIILHMSVRPSGEQFELVAGDQRATVVEVGAGMREYEVEGRLVLDAYPADRMRDGAHGAPLVPWPNRIDGGRYAFAGDDHQLALTEPEAGNAIHGFGLWRPWQAVERAADSVVMAARFHPRQGYPFALDVRVAYRLDSDGLSVETTATNIGARACPYGQGHHPYLSPGAGLIDGCRLQLPGRTRLLTDERGIPSGREPVEGTGFDFLEPRLVGHAQVDHAFTDLVRDASGRAWTRLWSPDGACRELWQDGSYEFVEVFTGDALAPARRRRGLAAEPMSCAPNAFVSGDGTVTLEPGESFSGTWGVRLG
jgi:aldose 1-epimerase